MLDGTRCGSVGGVIPGRAACCRLERAAVRGARQDRVALRRIDGEGGDLRVGVRRTGRRRPRHSTVATDLHPLVVAAEEHERVNRIDGECGRTLRGNRSVDLLPAAAAVATADNAVLRGLVDHTRVGRRDDGRHRVVEIELLPERSSAGRLEEAISAGGIQGRGIAGAATRSHHVIAGKATVRRRPRRAAVVDLKTPPCSKEANTVAGRVATIARLCTAPPSGPPPGT